MRYNILQEKSYAFAIRIVNMHKHLLKEKADSLARQVLRSGTSIGANVEESIGASSTKDFYNKLTIAYKEARETHFWIRLLRHTDYLEKNAAESLLTDCMELLESPAPYVRSSYQDPIPS